MKKTFLCASIFALTACGGGGGSDSATPAPTPTPTPAPDPAPEPSQAIGLWYGEVSTVDGGAAELAAIISADGNARFARLDTAETVVAQLTLEEAAFASDSAAYYYDNGKASGGNVTGSVADGILTGEAAGMGETLSYSLERLPESDDTPSLDAASGNYADDSVSIGIDVDGVITGSDTFGCVLTGQLSIPDENYNIYGLALTVESCGEINGEYTGLASYATVPVDDSALSGLVYSVSNDSYALSDYLIKAD